MKAAAERQLQELKSLKEAFIHTQLHHELLKRCLQRWTLRGYLPAGLLLLKPFDLLMHRRESFLLELIAQRVGGSLLCFSNQSLNF